MKSKLLSAICMPAALAIGAATAMAQDANPPAAPSPAPAERAPDPAAPSPSPAPSAAPTTPAPSPSAEAPSSDTAKSASNFSSTQSGDEWRSSKLVGMAVYNRANERVGDINDLILGPDGKVASAVIGVGGFLGIGEKLVAVDFSELQLNRDADGSMRATINSTKESLESAPDYKFAK
jgi:sporulation protein YlmC with PRC-barrel domain